MHLLVEIPLAIFAIIGIVLYFRVSRWRPQGTQHFLVLIKNFGRAIKAFLEIFDELLTNLFKISDSCLGGAHILSHLGFLECLCHGFQSSGPLFLGSKQFAPTILCTGR